MIGILAFGSLRDQPGCEINAKLVERRCVTTPFRVEFARYSCRRGGAPTLVPVHSGGAQVKAEVLVLDDSVGLEDAKNMLRRREIHKTNCVARYKQPKQPGRNHVLVDELSDFEGLETVIYTNFAPSGKIADPDPTELAEKAINSVKKADSAQDGITYLMNAKKMSVATPLTPAYESEILRLTCTNTLDEALQWARDNPSSPST